MQSHEEHTEARLTAITRLTVASLNLHCGLGWRGEPFDVAGAICGLDATVICLQEAWLPEATATGDASAAAEGPVGDTVAAAARRLGTALYRVRQRSGMSLAGFGLADSGSGDLCLAILTALPVTGYEVRSLGRAPADSVPRLAQIVRLRLADETSVRIVNTHLTHRLTSPLQLRRLWRYLRRRPEPTIIAGDLNMPRLIAARLAGYKPAVSGRSWPAWQPLVQLDHVLVSREIGVVAGSVLAGSVLAGSGPAGVGPAGAGLAGAGLAPASSDHLPVRATITIETRLGRETAERKRSPD